MSQTLNLSTITKIEIGHEKQILIEVDNFLTDPAWLVERAALQKFARINPYYPGIRALVDPEITSQWFKTLSPMLSEAFGTAPNGWEGETWFSIVTTAPQQLKPIQRLPHVDGTDPDQIALMLHLHETPHGGTGFFRHLSTGFESLSAERYAQYDQKLRKDVSVTGLPPASYPTDGAPHFRRYHVADPVFNRAIFYRGNIFHSGVINNLAPLSADPGAGRLTVNAFLRPKK